MDAINIFSSLPVEVKIFLWIALIAFTGAILFIVFLLGSRQLKNQHRKKEAAFQERFQNSLNVILLMDASKDEPAASVQFYQEQLMRDMGTSKLAWQVMIDQLMSLKKSLVGSSADSLTNVYKKLKLNIYSQQKSETIGWSKRSQGIFELAQMNERDSFEKIKPNLNSSNETVREEALMALVKLDHDSSLHFLNDFQAPLSQWMVMRIHQYLANSDKRKLPNFSQWFKHTNPDVALFALDMTRHFKQLNSVPLLIELLRDTDKDKVLLVIETLGDLDAHEAADALSNCVSEFWDNEKLSKQLARSLGKTGHKEIHWQKLVFYLSHPSYSVRFEAAQALHSSGNDSLLKLEASKLNVEDPIHALINHIEDPLLQS